MKLATRVALVDALAVFSLGCVVMTDSGSGNFRTIDDLLVLGMVAFVVPLVFLRVRQAYSSSTPSLLKAMTEGSVWGVVLALLMQAAVWAFSLSQGYTTVEDIAASRAPLTLLAVMAASAGLGIVVAMVLREANGFVVRRLVLQPLHRADKP